MSDRPYWCEICARKKECYGITLKPKCFVPITNTASGTPESYLAKSLRYSQDSHEIAKTEPKTCSVNGRPYDCGNCEHFRCTADEPQTNKEIVLDPSFAELSDEQFVEAMKLIEPQTEVTTDCRQTDLVEYTPPTDGVEWEDYVPFDVKEPLNHVGVIRGETDCA